MGHVGFSIWMEVDRIKNKTEAVNTTVNVDTSTPNESLIIADNIIKNCSLPHENWKIPTAMAISTATSSTSFLLMTLLILLPVYSYIRKCVRPCRNDSKILCRVFCNLLCKVLKKVEVISPFEDNKNNSTHHCVSSATILLLFSYWVSSLLYFGIKEYMYDMHRCLMNGAHLISFVFRLFSQFCVPYTAASFFLKLSTLLLANLIKLLKIWTKLTMKKINYWKNLNFSATSVENEPVDIKELLRSPDKANQKRGCYYLLQNIDGNLIDCVKPILDLFGYWFILHWVLYGLSTVLLSASVVELVVDIFKPSPMDKVVPFEGEDLKRVYIVYVVFTLWSMLISLSTLAFELPPLLLPAKN